MVLGIVVAVGEVRKRLGTMEGFWLLPGTWVLFAAYVAVPVALFWLLDRTGAVNDTSLFAAFLIGFGYQGIITGGNQSLRAPGDVSAMWTPFVAYADRVAKAALERGARNQRRLAEKVIVEIMKEQARYDALQALALDRSSEIKAVQDALAQIDGAAGLGAGDKREKKTRYLYGIVLSVPDVDYFLRNKNIVDGWFYWMHIRRYGQLIPLVLVIVAIVLALTYLLYTSYSSRDVGVTYHSWRVGKTNSSGVDQYRSRRELAMIMAGSAEHRRQAVDKLIYLVQRPGLPMERVDLVLQTLLEAHPVSAKSELPPKLIQGLRVNSLDARTRIHDALVFLATPCSGKPDPALKDWKPTEKDSSTMLEEKITAWSAYWAGGCTKT